MIQISCLLILCQEGYYYYLPSAEQITFAEVFNTLHVHRILQNLKMSEPTKESSVNEDQEFVIPAVTDALYIINVVDIFLKLKQDHQVR